jgi:phosphatidylserine decarboxylase
MMDPKIRPLAIGWPVIAPLLALAILIRRRSSLLSVLLAAGAAFVAWTFRDPDRDVVRHPALALAPADGRVLHVDRVWDDYWEQWMLEVGIFMAIWDVHVQRAPIDATIVEQRRRIGENRPAMTRAATTANHQLATFIDTEAGPMVVTQITGMAARRIITWVVPGSRVTQGDRIGMITLGSQTTLRVPESALVLVEPGDTVRAGVTPLARVQ